MKNPSSPLGQHPDMQLMRAGVEGFYPVKLRKKVFMLRPLSMQETINISRQVASEISELPEEERLATDQAYRIATKTIELASTSAPGKFDPQLSEKVLADLFDEEVEYLWKQYLSIRAKVNPMLEEMPTEEVAYLVEQVKKSPELSTLIDRSFLDLANITLYLIRQQQPADK